MSTEVIPAGSPEGSVTAVRDGSEIDLREGLVKGDRATFEGIVERYRDRVFQMAIWQVGRSQAEDLAQDIFVEVFRSAHTFRGRSSFSTWLYSVAKNVCRRHIRKRSTAPKILSLVDSENFGEVPDPTMDTARSAQTKESQGLVRKAVEELPMEHRMTLILREWEGLSYQEIAEVLKIPVGTVRSRLFNARSMLAERLEDNFQGAQSHVMP
ncbi:MAG: RNA polymerase sigma factor [Deltaproteobacteria bacterium]|nr:RNA polymerase sigma factor [Deltaproteobacteria bacterium]